MREASDYARQLEASPVRPAVSGEWVSGYGVMGLPFYSGHVLGLRRWTASHTGDDFTSIWHRDPNGVWTVYESAGSAISCSRYWGSDLSQVRRGPIRLEWEGPRRLRIRTEAEGEVDWTVELGHTVLTRAMSFIGSALPAQTWRSQVFLRGMSAIAGPALGVGKVQLSGTTSNGQHYDQVPLRLWYVVNTRAFVEGSDLGRLGRLGRQARMADFYFPQRGIFAVGGVFITPLSVAVGPDEAASTPI